MQKGRVVGAGAELLEGQIGSAGSDSRLSALSLRDTSSEGCDAHARPLAGGEAHTRFRVLDHASHVAHEMLQRLTAAGPQESAPRVVRVDIDDCLALELLRMCFHPFSGAQEIRLFTVPARVDQCALGSPAGA